jgi:hypothetical protein
MTFDFTSRNGHAGGLLFQYWQRNRFPPQDGHMTSIPSLGLEPSIANLVGRVGIEPTRPGFHTVSSPEAPMLSPCS